MQDQNNEYYNQGYDFGYEEGYEGEDLSDELPDFSDWSEESVKQFNLGRSDGQGQGASDC